jgi:phage host-nuclease inhibitor protein Gam
MDILSFTAGSGTIITIGLLIIFFMKDCFLQHLINKVDPLANREDIKNITDAIEQVESKLLRETQDIKNNLAVNYNQGAHSLNEERNAIVEFNKNYFSWFELYSTMYTIGGFVNNNDIEEYLTKVESLNLELVYSIVNIEFFVKDNRLTSMINQLKEDTFETFKDINLELVKYFKSSNFELDIINTFHDKSESEESTVELFESRTAKYNEFSSKAAFLKKEIVVMQKEVLDYCKAYILSLTQ